MGLLSSSTLTQAAFGSAHSFGGFSSIRKFSALFPHHLICVGSFLSDMLDGVGMVILRN